MPVIGLRLVVLQANDRVTLQSLKDVALLSISADLSAGSCCRRGYSFVPVAFSSSLPILSVPSSLTLLWLR